MTVYRRYECKKCGKGGFVKKGIETSKEYSKTGIGPCCQENDGNE